MQAIEISVPGNAHVLQLTTRAIPLPKLGEVLIKVAAAGINRPDILQRKGFYPPPPGASDLPGLEVAGTIVEVGKEVSQWRIGDQVCALVTGGGYAEYCVASAGHCLPIPPGLNLIEAASLPEAFFTVWSNLIDRGNLGNLKPGETLLIQGGSSGIGVYAIQMACALGHRVFATAGSEEKCKACITLGAEQAINYKTQDFVQEIKSLTQGKGVDLILDMVAGDYIAREISILADDGRLVVIAFLGGAKATIDFSQIITCRLTITGSTLRARSTDFKTAIANALRKNIWPLLESGKIKPVIYATFPLEKAAEAHALMESGVHIGKIVLTIS